MLVTAPRSLTVGAPGEIRVLESFQECCASSERVTVPTSSALGLETMKGKMLKDREAKRGMIVRVSDAPEHKSMIRSRYGEDPCGGEIGVVITEDRYDGVYRVYFPKLYTTHYLKSSALEMLVNANKLEVRGAGNSKVNGRYRCVASACRRPLYINNDETVVIQYINRRTRPKWRIFANKRGREEEPLYEVEQDEFDAFFPPPNGWMCNKGKGPAPTILIRGFNKKEEA